MKASELRKQLEAKNAELEKLKKIKKDKETKADEIAGDEPGKVLPSKKEKTLIELENDIYESNKKIEELIEQVARLNSQISKAKEKEEGIEEDIKDEDDLEERNNARGFWDLDEDDDDIDDERRD